MNFQPESLPLLYKTLISESRPIFLYGTGDGADKILDTLARFGVPVEGVFVSEEFYRGQTFRGYRVTTLSALEAQYPADGFVVLVAFGSHLPEMIERVKSIAARHPLLIPDMPVAGHDLFDEAYFQMHRNEIEKAYALWEDDASRRVFTDILEYKLTGAPEPLFRCVSPKEEVFAKLLPLGVHEDYLDVGAYNGDTVREFLDHTGGAFHSITAMEPEKRSYRKLCETASALGLIDRVDELGGLTGDTVAVLPDHARPVRLLNAAASDQTRTVSMVHGRGRGSALGSGVAHTGKMIETRFQKVDELELPLTYVKMDVEGMEAEALCGMKETLLRFRPKMNIALYHRSEDLFALPLLLDGWLGDYRFYLRRHDCFPCWEVNLYAVPK